MNNTLILKKIERKLITPDLTSKLFINNKQVKMKMQFSARTNFRIDNSKDFKIMKTIIGMELIFGQRPKVIASLLKKSLIINLEVTPKNLQMVYWLSYLQKSPMPWNSYVENFNPWDHGFYSPSVTVKNLKMKLTINNKKLSLLDTWIKSAYLD